MFSIRYALLIMTKQLFQPTHEILVLNTSSNSEDSGEPAQMRRLARAIVADISRQCVRR